MGVRNFWLEGQVDGRATRVEGGPRSKDGGFDLTVYIRDEGGIETAVQMRGRAMSDGELILDVSPASDVKNGGHVEALSGGGFRVTAKR